VEEDNTGSDPLTASALFFLVFAAPAFAQDARVNVRVEVRNGEAAVAGAVVAGADARATTDSTGAAILSLPRGRTAITVTGDGYLPASVDVDVSGSPGQVVRVELVPQPSVEEEITVVATTRTGRRVEDQPMRVEVLGREEIEEKMLMTPGDIVMMLNEMGGLRVQATSPSLGAASVRIQGMRGRYTQFLSDGLPLFGGQPGGLGLLQIPPMDLAQVEVIKGVASALYGAGAMGGVVNLLSRRPGEEFEGEYLINRTTRGGTDAAAFLGGPLGGKWGMTLLGSAHWQSQHDADGDQWADLPRYSRVVARPRLFWDDKSGRSLFMTAGVTWEDRVGGTLDEAALPATGLPFRESLETRNFDMGVMAQTLVKDRFVVAARAAFARQAHSHEFGARIERDRHRTAFAEVTVRSAAGRHTWVAGAAVEHDRYRSIDVPRFSYTESTPGVFAQDDIDLKEWLRLSISGRLDHHSEYGWFFSPRVSVLARSGDWTSRLSAGTGFHAPTALTEETEAAGLFHLEIPTALRAERGRSVSLDVTRAVGPAEVTVTLFGSEIRSSAHVNRESFTLRSLDCASTNAGVELLATLRRGPFVATGTYTYVRSQEQEGLEPLDVPLTPRHSAGVVAMIESEDTGRVGLEVYFTGRQRLEANPYRTTSAPYVIVGLLAERRVGRVRLFINGENLTGVRQSKWHPLLRPVRAADGRWTVDGWAPLEGRTINGGIRF